MTSSPVAPEAHRNSIDLARFGDKPLWLEIGFGGGEHLVHMAARYPQIGIIGCEPFVNGIAMLLGKIRAAGVNNLAIHPGDVRDLFDAFLGKPRIDQPDRAALTENPLAIAGYKMR